MATVYSTQRANENAGTKNAPYDKGGRVRIAVFEYTTPSGGVAVNDVIELVKLPKDARIIGGRAAWEAMSSGAGTATVTIGVSGAASKYLGSTSVDAAGETDFANTLATNMLDKLSADTVLIATAGGEAWAGTKKFNGYVLYVLD